MYVIFKNIIHNINVKKEKNHTSIAIDEIYEIYEIEIDEI